MRYSVSTGCFYPEWGDYGSDLPEDIVTIPEEDFQLALNRPENSRIKLVDGRILIEDIVKDINQVLADREQEIRSKYSSMLLALAAPYSQEERETWKTQEEEALQWINNQESLCPMVRQMATNRGISMELMVSKILNSADKFRKASGQVLGLQQAELDIIYPDKKEEV